MPGPQSIRFLDSPVSARTEHELLSSDVTHVPDPSIVNVISVLSIFIVYDFEKFRDSFFSVFILYKLLEEIPRQSY